MPRQHLAENDANPYKEATLEELLKTETDYEVSNNRASDLKQTAINNKLFELIKKVEGLMGSSAKDPETAPVLQEMAVGTLSLEGMRGQIKEVVIEEVDRVLNRQDDDLEFEEEDRIEKTIRLLDRKVKLVKEKFAGAQLDFSQWQTHVVTL